MLGIKDGFELGKNEGKLDHMFDGCSLGSSVGDKEGSKLGILVGRNDGIEQEELAFTKLCTARYR